MLIMVNFDMLGFKKISSLSFKEEGLKLTVEFVKNMLLFWEAKIIRDYSETEKSNTQVRVLCPFELIS